MFSPLYGWLFDMMGVEESVLGESVGGSGETFAVEGRETDPCDEWPRLKALLTASLRVHFVLTAGEDSAVMGLGRSPAEVCSYRMLGGLCLDDLDDLLDSIDFLSLGELKLLLELEGSSCGECDWSRVRKIREFLLELFRGGSGAVDVEAADARRGWGIARGTIGGFEAVVFSSVAGFSVTLGVLILRGGISFIFWLWLLSALTGLA